MGSSVGVGVLVGVAVGGIVGAVVGGATVGAGVSIIASASHKSWSEETGLKLPQELTATTSHLYVFFCVIGKIIFVVPDGIDSLVLTAVPVSTSVTDTLYETAPADSVHEQLAWVNSHCVPWHPGYSTLTPETAGSAAHDSAAFWATRVVVGEGTAVTAGVLVGRTVFKTGVGATCALERVSCCWLSKNTVTPIPPSTKIPTARIIMAVLLIISSIHASLLFILYSQING